MSNRTKYSCGLYVFLIIATIACLIISGGCGGGGGGSSSSIKNGVVLAYDTDKDGIPDIFDDFPNDASKSAYPYIEMNSKSAAGAGSVTTLSVPCTSDGFLYAPVAKSVDITSGDEKVGAITQYVEDNCQYSVSLDAGVSYAMMFATFPESADVDTALAFDPKLVIKDASGKEISYDVKDPDDDSNKGMVSVVFKAPSSGKYSITISDPFGVVDKTDEYFYFNLFEDDDEDGLPYVFMSKDYVLTGNSLTTSAISRPNWQNALLPLTPTGTRPPLLPIRKKSSMRLWPISIRSTPAATARPRTVPASPPCCPRQNPPTSALSCLLPIMSRRCSTTTTPPTSSATASTQ